MTNTQTHTHTHDGLELLSLEDEDDYVFECDHCGKEDTLCNANDNRGGRHPELVNGVEYTNGEHLCSSCGGSDSIQRDLCEEHHDYREHDQHSYR